MDPLSEILSLLRPRTYVTGGLSAGGGWGVRFPTHNVIKCYSVVTGECWLSVETVPEPVRLQSGSCLLLPRGLPFVLASDLSLPHRDSWKLLSKRERYNGILPVNPGDDFLILGSHFELEGNARFLLDVLPPIVMLENELQRESLRWAVERMVREMRDPQPGGTLIAQQVAYTMVVHASRACTCMDVTGFSTFRRDVANRICADIQENGRKVADGINAIRIRLSASAESQPGPRCRSSARCSRRASTNIRVQRTDSM